jgi:enterochelin esterase-like enzyme
MASSSELLRRARRDGTPLIDPVRGKPHRRKLTLLFQADPTTKSVSVLGNLTGWDLEQGRMARIGRSNLWSYSQEVADDLRTTYQIGADDSGVPFYQEKHWMRRMAGWRADPLNPQRFTIPRDPEVRGDRDFVYSLVRLPRAPRDPLAEPRGRVPHGTVTVHRLRSRILRNTRRVWLYAPPVPAATTRPCNLIIAFDGAVHTKIIPVPTILDNCLARGLLGPTWMVSVDSLTQKDRGRELGCYPPFVSFLAGELLPWLRRKVRGKIVPSRTVLAGQSRGGLAAIHALISRPDLFGHVLSQSGAFGYDPKGGEGEWLAREVARSNLTGRRLYLEAGKLEATTWLKASPTLLTTNRHMRDVLVAKGHDVLYREFQGGHDYPCWRESFSAGLRWCLPRP